MKLAVVAALLMCACTSRGNLPPPRTDRPQAGTAADCARGCKHLRSLGCELADPGADGTTCEAFCEATEESGNVTLMPACWATVKTCDDVDRICTY